MPAKAGGSYFFRFSICPDWITGGLGSVISQAWGFFSSSFMAVHLGSSIRRCCRGIQKSGTDCSVPLMIMD